MNSMCSVDENDWLAEALRIAVVLARKPNDKVSDNRESRSAKLTVTISVVARHLRCICGTCSRTNVININHIVACLCQYW